MKKITQRLLPILSAMLFVVSAAAQVTTSSLAGRVVEQGGEPLVGAVVTAVHTPTGSQYYAVANNDGHYFINGMRAGGPYKIEVSFLGMSPVQYDDIWLKLGEEYALDASLKSSTQLEAATVVSKKSFNASITGAGSSFSQERMESIPTIERSIQDIVKYTPQAGTSKVNKGISFAGTNNRYNSFRVDGALANDSFGLAASGTNGGQANANPVSLDAIEEIQVVIAPFDVRQSGFTGGAINAVTKSGTNQVKGTAYAHYFDKNLVGVTPGPLSGPMAIPPADGKRHKYEDEVAETFGFTVGAPIIKNKLFLFVSGEYYMKSYPNVYAPSEGSYDARPFKDGTVLDANRAQDIITHYNTTFGIDSGESYSLHQKKDRSINALARVDWNINDANKLMVRYQFGDSYADKYGASATSYTFNNSAYKQANRTNTLVAELNTRVNDTMSNELRLSGVFVRDHREIPYLGPLASISDNVSVAIGTEFSSGANAMNSDTYTLTDNFTFALDNQNITIGTHNEFYRFSNIFLQGAAGRYQYDSLADFLADTPKAYDYRYADPDLTGGETIWAAPTTAAQFGVYGQVEWRLSRNLQVTYGLRVDAPVLLNKPTENEVFNATDFATKNGEYVGVVPRFAPLFSPRLGFRWYLDDEHKSLLRGGTGVFTGRVPFVWLSNAYNNTGMETKSVTVKPIPAGFPLTSDPYNDIVKGAGYAGSAAGQTINTLNRKFKYPQNFRTNIGFDREFEGGWKLTLDAIFSKQMNNVYFKNLAIESDKTVYAVNADYTGADKVAPYYKVASSAYYRIVALDNTNKGYSYTLSGQLRKHFNFGLDLMASYTFGHSYSINDGTSSVAFSNWCYNYAVDPNSADELSFASFDRPHRVLAVANYSTPIYGRRFRTSVSLTYEGYSGQRYSYTMKETNTTDFNGDGYYGNSLMYVPTREEVQAMNWSDAESAFKFERFIRSDKYLSSHRGAWSKRLAGMAPFEHHFDLQVSEDIYYDVERKRKLQIFANFLNVSNLLNPEWGMYYDNSYNRNILQVDALSTDAAGNVTPTYSYYDDNGLHYSDFYSRWRCQLGVRISF
ncbi:MAG: TonB-dependent receptor [Bacteroidales bacterium]|nr:TonB-dependent receptor [Bacteroidales bacterium]